MTTKTIEITLPVIVEEETAEAAESYKRRQLDKPLKMLGIIFTPKEYALLYKEASEAVYGDGFGRKYPISRLAKELLFEYLDRFKATREALHPKHIFERLAELDRTKKELERIKTMYKELETKYMDLRVEYDTYRARVESERTITIEKVKYLTPYVFKIRCPAMIADKIERGAERLTYDELIEMLKAMRKIGLCDYEIEEA